MDGLLLTQEEHTNTNKYLDRESKTSLFLITLKLGINLKRIHKTFDTQSDIDKYLDNGSLANND